MSLDLEDIPIKVFTKIPLAFMSLHSCIWAINKDRVIFRIPANDYKHAIEMQKLRFPLDVLEREFESYEFQTDMMDEPDGDPFYWRMYPSYGFCLIGYFKNP